MGLLKTTKDIIGLLAAEFISRALLGTGLFLIILGGIVAYAIVSSIMHWLDFEASTIKIVATTSTLITFLIGTLLTVSGIGLMIWAREKEL